MPPALESTGVYNLLHFDEGDDAGYYAYLRSLFFDHDIDFFNEFYYAHRREVLDTGYVANFWKIGSAILWSPFFILAHVITLFYNFLGEPLSQDGLSFVYVTSTALASSTYVCFGLVLHFLILRRWFSRSAALLSVLLFFLATGLVYFAFIRSRMAHANDYFLICLFVYSWLSFRDRLSFSKGVFLGLTGGLMLLTRINSAGYFLLPLYDLARRAFTRIRRGDQSEKLVWFPYIPVFGLGFLTYSLQLNVNRILAGSASPINNSLGFRAQLFSPENWAGIFSNSAKILWGESWGLLWHAPVYLFGAVGLYFFVKRLRDPGIPFLLALSPPIVLFMVWPHHGLSYGPRHLLTVNLLFSIGLAELYTRWSFRLKPILWSIGSFFLILWSYMQIGFFKVVVPHDSKNFVWQVYKSLKLYWFPHKWLRGENLIYVLFHRDFRVETTLDWYLIVIHPFLQAIILLILLFTGVFIWAKMNLRPELEFRVFNSINITVLLFIVFLHLLIQIQGDRKTPDFIDKRKAEVNEQVFPLINPSHNTTLQDKP